MKVRRFLVEAPGTAPGSNRLITKAVYRHSRIKSGTNHIGCSCAREKMPRRLNVKRKPQSLTAREA